MKRLKILFFLLIKIAVVAQGQSSDDRYTTGFKSGIEVGGLWQKSGNKTASRLDVGYALKMDFLEFRLTPHFSVNLGIGFTHREYQQVLSAKSGNLEVSSIKEHLTLKNVEVPLMLKYYLTEEEQKVRFFWSVGGAIHWNLNHSGRQELFFHSGSILETNYKNTLSRRTFSGILSYGAVINTGFRVSYIIEPTIQINPNAVDFYHGTTSKSFVNFGLLVGFRF
jgi:hypothetical protein